MVLVLRKKASSAFIHVFVGCCVIPRLIDDLAAIPSLANDALVRDDVIRLRRVIVLEDDMDRGRRDTQPRGTLPTKTGRRARAPVAVNSNMVMFVVLPYQVRSYHDKNSEKDMSVMFANQVHKRNHREERSTR